MLGQSPKSSLPSITARPTPAEKARFRWLADRVGLSESALALAAIRSILGADSKVSEPAHRGPGRVAASDRLTIRLRPGDGAVIAARASARGMKASAYLAGLVRAHASKNPPLPSAELAAVKEGVEVLARLGYALTQIAPQARVGVPEQEALCEVLRQTRAAVASLKRQVHEFAKASLIAWESRSE